MLRWNLRKISTNITCASELLISKLPLVLSGEATAVFSPPRSTRGRDSYLPHFLVGFFLLERVPSGYIYGWLNAQLCNVTQTYRPRRLSFSASLIPEDRLASFRSRFHLSTLFEFQPRSLDGNIYRGSPARPPLPYSFGLDRTTTERGAVARNSPIPFDGCSVPDPAILAFPLTLSRVLWSILRSLFGTDYLPS